ncbi:MAG: AAA family ATPase [Actinomycetaceae bacterium]|nr:AAA family ATPase [Actinomycetaceae bacterium]
MTDPNYPGTPQGPAQNWGGQQQPHAPQQSQPYPAPVQGYPQAGAYPGAPAAPQSQPAPPQGAPMGPGPSQAPAPQASQQQAPPSSNGNAFYSGAQPELNAEELRVRDSLVKLRAEIGKAVVGQHGAVTGLVIALVAGGHALLEGVPGVAKTLMVRTLAQCLEMKMARVQFTPDLMPADITGSLVWDAGSSSFEFRPGPVFTNLLLADEINRTPPKTQSSLLEAMEEHQVSVDGTTHRLDDPFMVIATQNPVEYEGTYPLPEAQLDRFLLKLELPLPERDDEIQVLTRHQNGFDPLSLAGAGVRPVAGPADILAARKSAAKVEVSPAVLAYVVDLVRATRTAPSLRLGVSPRGATALLRVSRVWAFLQGRAFVTPDDVKAMAVPTLAHRVGLRAEADLEGITARSVIESLLSQVPVPR